MEAAVKSALKLGEILVAEGILTPEQLEEALAVQKGSKEYLGSILIELGYASRSDVGRALQRQLGIEFVDLGSKEIDPAVLELLPERLVRRYRAVPLSVDGNTLHVAMADPLDLFAIDEMRLTSACKVKPYLAMERDVDQAIKRLCDARASAVQAIAELDLEDDERNEPAVDVLEEMIENSPIVRLVDSISAAAVDSGASDIHLEPQKEGMRVRYRVDGLLYDTMTIPNYLKAAVVSRIKVLAGMDIAERRRPQDGHISMTIRDSQYDLRVSTVRTVHGEKAVIRLLDTRRMLMSLNQLGFNPTQLAMVERIGSRPHGIILVTGPTGSGKTTMLYSVLNNLTKTTDNVITIEDPVECVLPNVNQIQVNPKAKVTFAEGLRCILRQDPNIIMVGEIRDLETAEIAIRAAMTGHLVFSTLHTNDAAGTATRLLDMGVEPFLISSSMIAAIATRLVRLACPNCATLAPAQSESQGEGRPQQVLTPVGCPECSNTGYRGRTGIFEIMYNSSSIQELILRRAHTQEIAAQAIKEGMQSLQESAREKVSLGLTTEAEIARVLDLDHE
ncbi:MAG: GspE/PulE family protein [Armatimonadota bacterium]